jgi:hypothetical protein
MYKEKPYSSLLEVQENSIYPDTGYLDRLDPSGKFVENSTELTCFEITVYQISTVQC